MSYCQQLRLAEEQEDCSLPPSLRLQARFDEPPAAPGLLAEPAVVQWPALARANRRLLFQDGLHLAGVPLAQVRRCLRDELPSLPLPTGLDDPVLLVTGHQPVLYHPGVWVKLFAGSQAAASAGGRLANIVVDSDAERLAVPVPAPGPEAGQVGVVMLEPAGTGSDHVPLERRPAPDARAWRAFLAEVEARLAPLLPATAGRLEELQHVEPQPGEVVASFFSRVRRAWEEGAPIPGPGGYVELFVSRLSQTLAFRLWLMEWALHAPFWREAYNEALRQYRALHKLRSPANPFPNLEATDQGIELPFWSLAQEGGSWARRPVLVERAGRAGREIRFRARTPSGAAPVLVQVPADDPLAAARLLGEAPVQFRPKAIPLTLFARLVVGDLFIHGTGGAKYETIGDFLMAARWPEAFSLAVPSYATASATLFLDVPAAREQAARLPVLEDLARSLDHNPQRVVAALQGPLGEEAARAGLSIDASLEALARRKAELVQAIQAGGDKKTLGRAIRAVNEELARRLEPARVYLERELEAARRAQAALTERAYPFFFFEPAQLWDLLGRASAPEKG